MAQIGEIPNIRDNTEGKEACRGNVNGGKGQEVRAKQAAISACGRVFVRRWLSNEDNKWLFVQDKPLPFTKAVCRLEIPYPGRVRKDSAKIVRGMLLLPDNFTSCLQRNPQIFL